MYITQKRYLFFNLYTQAKFQNIDGAFFGPTFPHLLFMTFEDLRPPLKVDQNLDDEDMHGDLGNYLIYTPRIFGFKLSQLSPVGPRMRWLRHKSGLLPQE